MFEISDNSVIGIYANQAKPSKALNITFWVLQFLVAAAFLMAGATKLAGAQMQVATFEKIGLGQWFRYFTGGFEVTCAILVMAPRAAALAAGLLAATIGAIATHLFIIGGSPIPAIALLVMTAAVAWYRGLYQ
jgi:hypothetical protein